MIKHLKKSFRTICSGRDWGQIINMKHELVQLARKIDWDWMRRGRAALQRERPARDQDPACDRAAVAQAYLRAVR